MEIKVASVYETDHPSLPMRSPVQLQSKVGSCLSQLNSSDMLRWGIRRRMIFPRKNLRSEKSCSQISNTLSISLLAQNQNQQNKDDGYDDEEKQEEKPQNGKRKLRSSSSFKNTRVSKLRKQGQIMCANNISKYGKDRWSVERYNRAEGNLFKIMKEKGAVLGKKIPRHELRAEARKFIADTGLLDHLLKHAAGNVSPDGLDRIRRRYTPEGVMEYWLESADLDNIRKQAGVEDPYWTPPPELALGDPIFAREFKELKEQVTRIKRDVEELMRSKSQQTEADRTIVVVNASDKATSKADLDGSSNVLSALVDIYQDLTKKKEEVEDLIYISNSLLGNEEVTKEKLSSGWELVPTVSGSGEGALATYAVAAEKEERPAETAPIDCKSLRSVFRICKPHGTFLWPNIASAVATSASCGCSDEKAELCLAQAEAVAVERLFPFKTPPSVSSSSKTPLPQLSQPSSSPVKPLAERRALPALTVSIVSRSASLGENHMSTCWSRASGPELDGSNSVSGCVKTLKNMVIDLNEVPTSVLSHQPPHVFWSTCSPRSA